MFKLHSQQFIEGLSNPQLSSLASDILEAERMIGSICNVDFNIILERNRRELGIGTDLELAFKQVKQEVLKRFVKLVEV